MELADEMHTTRSKFQGKICADIIFDSRPQMSVSRTFPLKNYFGKKYPFGNNKRTCHSANSAAVSFANISPQAPLIVRTATKLIRKSKFTSNLQRNSNPTANANDVLRQITEQRNGNEIFISFIIYHYFCLLFIIILFFLHVLVVILFYCEKNLDISLFSIFLCFVSLVRICKVINFGNLKCLYNGKLQF